MRKKEFIFIVLLAMAGCANSPRAARSVAVADSYALAKPLVERVLSGYRDFKRDVFESAVAEDFVPSRDAFVDRVERSAFSGPILSLDYFLEEAVQQDGNILFVKVKWDKKTRPYGISSPDLTRGACQFVFVLRDGQWQLSQVSGEDPF